jgi:hypothetical protein
MTEQPDHELEVLEDDQNVPPRPEELIADAWRQTVREADREAPAEPPSAEA